MSSLTEDYRRREQSITMSSEPAGSGRPIGIPQPAGVPAQGGRGGDTPPQRANGAGRSLSALWAAQYSRLKPIFRRNLGRS